MSMKPTAAEVITAGGWSPRYARVLVVEGNGTRALALVDTNGDGREINENRYWREESGSWHSGSSSGSVPSRPATHPFGFWRDEQGVVSAYGRTATAGPVTVEVDDRLIEAVATEGGWWVWLRP